MCSVLLRGQLLCFLSFSACKFASLWLSFCVKASAFVTVLVTPAFWTYLPSSFSEGIMFGCTYTNPEVKVCRCLETAYSTVKRPLALPSLRTTTGNIQKAVGGKLEVWLALGRLPVSMQTDCGNKRQPTPTWRKTPDTDTKTDA